MSSIEIANFIRAAGSLGATGTAVWQRGAVGTLAAAGSYLLTMPTNSGGLDSTECAIFVTPRGTAKVTVQTEHTSDLIKTVKTFDNANAALNSAFDWMICMAPGG